jgi:hypothetical protein
MHVIGRLGNKYIPRDLAFPIEQVNIFWPNIYFFEALAILGIVIDL